MTYHFAAVRAYGSDEGFRPGPAIRAGYGQYGCARAAEPPRTLGSGRVGGDPHREVVTGGGANRENLP